MSVVVVGSINVDLHLRVERHPLPGETLLASGGTYSPGGKGANQACASALAGGRTTMLGAVGADGGGEALRLLAEAGVDLSHLIGAESPTGLAVVTVDEQGENTVLVVPGANSAVSADAVDDWADLIAGASVVVTQGEIPAEATRRVADLSVGRLLLNLAPAIRIGPATLRLADPLVVNEHEAALALAQLGEGETTEPRGLVRALLDSGVRTVVLTLGAAGALIGEGGEIVEVAAPRVVARDSVGAGDAFVGALAARLSAGESLLGAARYACRFAAHTVQFDGAQASYPAPGTALPKAR